MNGDDKKNRAEQAAEKQAIAPDDKNDFTGIPNHKLPDLEPTQSPEGQVEQAEQSTKRDKGGE
jgi:hypothetical protein